MQQHLAALLVTPVRLHDGTTVVPSTSVRNLGELFDNEMTMVVHVNSITSSCFLHLRLLRFIRQSLKFDAARMLVNAFIFSKVDYNNALLYGVISCYT